MSKKPRDVVKEHEEAVREFEARPAPEVWACFFWPKLDRWQAIAAWKEHEVFIEPARQLAIEGRKQFGETTDDSKIAGDCLNACAELVLSQSDDGPRMAGLLLAASRHFKMPYMFLVCTHTDRGSGVDVREIAGVSNVEEARNWVDRQPEIRVAKMNLLSQVMKGPQH